MELVVTWKKAAVAAVLVAVGVAGYYRFFRRLPSMGTDELFAEYMSWNPAAKRLLKERKMEHPVVRLQKYLSHERRDVRVLAAELLGRPDDAEALDALSPAAGDISPDVRVQVARSLAEIGVRKEVVPILASMLDDEDTHVQVSVTRALKAVSGERSVHGIDGWKTWWDMHQAGY